MQFFKTNFKNIYSLIIIPSLLLVYLLVLVFNVKSNKKDKNDYNTSSDAFQKEYLEIYQQNKVNLTYTIQSDTFIISGAGNMYNYNRYQTPWNNKKDSVKYAIIEENASLIRDCAFYDFNQLISIIIASSVTSIECDAFLGCTQISSMTIPKNVNLNFKWCICILFKIGVNYYT